MKTITVSSKQVICLLSFSLIFAFAPHQLRAQPTRYGTGSGTGGYCGSYFGYYSGGSTTGSYNTFLGNRSGYTNTSGTQNVFIGHESGYFSNGSYNVFIGVNSGHANLSGSSNVFIGRYCGFHNTAGNNNSFTGYFSGYSNKTGNNNTFMGLYSGYSQTTGSNNTYIGRGAGYGNTTGSNNVFLGYGAGRNETGSNKLYITNNSTSAPLIYGDFGSGKLVVNGICTDPKATLTVNGDIVATKVQILETVPCSDYVFSPGYKLLPLNDLDRFIKANRHLPEIQSAQSFKENGYSVGEMDDLLLRKIEELTLYTIDQQELIEQQQELFLQQQKLIEELEQKVEHIQGNQP